MPLTVPNARAVLVSRLGGKLTFVGKSLTTSTANPDLDYAIATAVVALGGTVADFAGVADDDLSRVTNIYAFFGLAELFTLRDIWSAMTDVTETEGPRTQAWSNLSGEILARIDKLEAMYRTYLTALKPLTAGTIKLPFVRAGGPEF